MHLLRGAQPTESTPNIYSDFHSVRCNSSPGLPPFPLGNAQRLTAGAVFPTHSPPACKVADTSHTNAPRWPSSLPIPRSPPRAALHSFRSRLPKFASQRTASARGAIPAWCSRITATGGTCAEAKETTLYFSRWSFLRALRRIPCTRDAPVSHQESASTRMASASDQVSSSCSLATC